MNDLAKQMDKMIKDGENAEHTLAQDNNSQAAFKDMIARDLAK